VLASGSADNTIILWDVATHEPLGSPLARHLHWVESVAFSPDGKLLASGSADSTIILWDVATHEPLGPPLEGHTGRVPSLSFSPDGKTLASGGEDTRIILWDVDFASWRARACARAARNLTPEEWRLYLGDESYHKTCPDLP
jgi:WD40 repeat protein